MTAPLLPTVHMFWHGAPLSRMERLSLTSFVANDHPVELWVYDQPRGVPAGVQLCDAARILPRENLFRHRRTGSFALFSDWFRYRLLHQQGGVWSDTDVVCLRPLDYAQPVIFAWQDQAVICGAVLGLPPGHRLAEWLAACCEDPNRVLPYDSLRMRLRKWKRRYLQGNRRDRLRWGEYGPHGLTAAVRYFGFDALALPPAHFYPVPCNRWRTLFEEGALAIDSWPAESRAVHLWNNMSHEMPGFDKNRRFPPNSPFEQLCQRYLKSDG